MLNVNNLPETFRNYNWLVCSVVDGELWYYGVYTDHDKASEVAVYIGGVVVLPTLVAA